MIKNARKIAVSTQKRCLYANSLRRGRRGDNKCFLTANYEFSGLKELLANRFRLNQQLYSFIWSFRPLELALFEKKEFPGAILENLLFSNWSSLTANFVFLWVKKDGERG